VKWLGLDVREHLVLDSCHAEVEFVARQKPAGSPAVRLHERSRFVLEAGRWYYVDGALR
jgi:SEC-C motif-containing protein